MKPQTRIALAATLLCTFTWITAWATDIKRLDVGDIVYQAGVLGVANVTQVQVVRVDTETGKVKVRDVESGVVEWVAGADIYTADELRNARAKLALKALDAAASVSRTMDITKLKDACYSTPDLVSLVISTYYFGAGHKEAPVADICRCVATEMIDSESQENIQGLLNNYTDRSYSFFEGSAARYTRYLKKCTPPEFSDQLAKTLEKLRKP